MLYKFVLWVTFLWILIPDKALSVEQRLFPSNFKFGCATASYQIEGAWNEDGKGENIWDHICHTNPTYVQMNHSGDIACDSYHKYKEDVSMLADLGAHIYRYSLSWSRILPYGVAGSPVNPLGIEYYRNLTQELLDNGIEPLVTMFHWDTPQIIEDLGGWPNPEVEEHYLYYARVVFEQLGDLVKLWMTFNEPKQICLQGYGNGHKAPGIVASGFADYQCTHTLLKAHARAYRLYDEEFRAEQQGKVGIVFDTPWYEPATASPIDTEASERALQFTMGWYANPIFNGNYPQVMIDRIGNRSEQQGFQESRLPQFTEEEIDYIRGTADFLAINAYSSNYVQGIAEEAPVDNVTYDTDLNANIYVDVDWEVSASAWLKVVPWGFRKLLNWIHNTYGQPEIFVTENGFSDGGGTEDDRRINYFKEYLSSLLEAILDDGINVTHYTAWSLMDNFEWARGYTEKFGLYSVDFDDPERPRTPKDSANYFKQVISTRCLVDECLE